MAKRNYVCTLRPLGEYFLGGERTFNWGTSDTDKKESYYIRSNIVPSQTTLLGMLRYIVLEANSMLNERHTGELNEEQIKLIGKSGFVMSDAAKEQDSYKKSEYGIIDSIGPLYIVDTIQNRKLIPAPLNHRVNNDEKQSNKQYTPFKMSGSYYTELGSDMILPTDYVAKDGLAYDCYMDCNTKDIIGKNDIFKFRENARVAVGKDEDAYFKKVYVLLRDNYEFQFGFSLDANDDGRYEGINTIVYLGQEKSAFNVRCRLAEDADCISVNKEEADKTDRKYAVIYLLSDAHIDDEALKYTLFYCTDSNNIRTLTDNSDCSNDSYKKRKKKSDLYKLYKSGSVFYLPYGDNADKFKKMLCCNANMRRIGYNQYIEL